MEARKSLAGSDDAQSKRHERLKVVLKDYRANKVRDFGRHDPVSIAQGSTRG